MRRTLALALLLAACNEESTPDDAMPPVIDQCEGLPALTLSAQPMRVRVNQAAELRPAGGSTRYTFELQTAASGGTVRGDRWVAGPTPGSDTVLVRDDCGNQASVTVEVRASFAVAPARATIKPGTRFKVRADGMLGLPVFRMQTAGSGGDIDDGGNYSAGPREGLDLIAVRDDASNEEVLLQYDVRSDAMLRGSPARVGVPSGASVLLSSAGGTDAVTWTKLSGPGDLQGGSFRAGATDTGEAVVQASDPFTGETAEVRVQVMEELAPSGRAHGRLSDVANLVTGDFDGDGMIDVALGVPESDLGRPAGGALFVFRGSADGLPATPTWIIEGDSDTGNLGAVLAAGDLDGDGHDDLAASAPGADITIADSGSVSLYKFGAEGPRLLRAPLTGLGRGNFGASLAIADVDGDGDRDLLIGSPGADLAPSNSIRERGVVDVFMLRAGQDIPDLGMQRLGGNDLAADGTRKTTTGLKFGRGLAVADFNKDGRADVATLGAVSNSLLGGVATAKSQIAVAVHFGRMGTPSFVDVPDLYILPANLADSSEGTWRLSATPDARILLTGDQIDSPDLSASGGVKSGGNSGGALIFDLSSEAAPAAPPERPKQLGRGDAFARLYGNEGGSAAGRGALVADVDGDGKAELVLGAPYASYNPMPKDNAQNIRQSGKLLVYPYATLSAGAELNQPSDFRAGATKSDTLGVAVTAAGETLYAFAARASTAEGDFTGRLDAFAGKGALAERARKSAELPAELASRQHGAALKLAVLDDQLRVLVGAPGFSGAGANGDGNDVGAGQSLLYTRGSREPKLVHEGADRAYETQGHKAFAGRGTGVDVAFTDFDGDGRKDLVVAAPNLRTPTMNNTDYAALDAACVTSSEQNNGGALVYIAQPDSSFREGFRLLAPSAIAGCTPADDNKCKRSGLARAGLVGDFDFDGDGKQDVMLTRNNGLEVFLGRAPVDASFAKPTLACDPVFSLPALAQGVSAPSALGDLDGDGCAEVALRYAQDQRAGLLVAYGYSTGGTRCKAHKEPAWLRISGDAESGLANMQLGLAATRAGKLLGDARDFVAVSAGAFPFRGITQPVVLLFDVAQWKRPASGEQVVGALNMGLTPLALVTTQRAVGFGRSLAGNVDLDGDGQPELVVAAPGASINGDGTGAVFSFRGGSTLAAQLVSGSAVLEPSALLVGDGSERASVGQALSVIGASARTPAAIGLGAPLSYRSGTANGSAWLYTF
ncbi:MAG: FG-GAP-like repeat-containing protein [Polyangiales bacterium]